MRSEGKKVFSFKKGGSLFNSMGVGVGGMNLLFLSLFSCRIIFSLALLVAG